MLEIWWGSGVELCVRLRFIFESGSVCMHGS
jgi:hypothetical protein